MGGLPHAPRALPPASRLAPTCPAPLGPTPQLWLLHAPLSRERLAWVAAALEWLALPVEALVSPLATHGSAYGAGPEEPADEHTAACRSTLRLLHFGLGLVVPLLLSVWRWQPPTEGAPGAAAAGGAGAAARLHAAVVRATAACNAGLKQLLDVRTGGRMGRAMIAWYCLYACWALAKAV